MCAVNKRSPTGLRHSLAVSKTDLLLFDEVRVMGLERQLSEVSGVDEAASADAAFLAEAGFLTEAPDKPYGVGVLLDEYFRDKYYEDGSPLRVVARLRASGKHPSSSDLILPPGSELVLSTAMNIVGESWVPVMPRRPTSADWEAIHSLLSVSKELEVGGDSLLEVVIDALPVPGDDVPLDTILDFCRDPTTRAQRERLMLALARARLDGRSTEAFALDIEEALVQFEQHMRVADLRTRAGGLRLVITSALGAIEELARLRPRRALDAVLDYREVRASRLEAQLQAAGSEAAFIYQAERTFGRR